MVMVATTPRSVVHLVDALGTTRLWGKERAIALLMDEQRRAGLSPRLVVFTPNALVEQAREAGFPADVLGSRDRIPIVATRRLCALLREEHNAIVHTHGYKANIVGRLARLAGAPMAGLIATVHGMNNETRALALYNQLDRISAPLSDAVTLADARLLEQFHWRGSVAFVANGVERRPAFSALERTRARRRFGFPDDAVVVGLVGRVSTAKGALDVIAAACGYARDGILFAFAGEGEVAERMRASVPRNVRFVGYVDDADVFLAGIDIYLQASHTEGLSLALLEAMRGGLPCIATRVGSTDVAIEDGRDGLLIAPHDPQGIREAVDVLADDPRFAAQLAASARARFETEFSIDRQQRRYREIYCALRA